MKLSGLTIYPIKSLPGLHLESATLDQRGLRDDRRWMLVDEDGVFLTQRTLPALCRFALQDGEEHWLLKDPQGNGFELPKAAPEGPEHRVQVWDCQIGAQESKTGSAFFSDALGRRVHLVHQGPQHHRPRRPGIVDDLSFADGYPLLIIGEASLADLNGRLESPVPMNRFRPNLVFEGGAPFVEDTFENVRIGDIAMHGPKRCERCVMTTVDQTTALKSKEPLATLATYRRDHGKVWFGMNLVHQQQGVLRVGDAVVRRSITR